MPYSETEKQPRKQSRKTTAAQGFAPKAGSSSPFPQSPEPSSPSSDTSGDVATEAEQILSDLIGQQPALSLGVEVGASGAPAFIAGMVTGLTTQLQLYPEQSWQAAIHLLPRSAPLTLEQRQQQTQGFLLEAIQAQFGVTELARLPASMRVTMGLPALPEPDGGDGEAIETPSETVPDSDIDLDESEPDTEPESEPGGEPEAEPGIEPNTESSSPEAGGQRDDWS